MPISIIRVIRHLRNFLETVDISRYKEANLKNKENQDYKRGKFIIWMNISKNTFLKSIKTPKRLPAYKIGNYQ